MASSFLTIRDVAKRPIFSFPFVIAPPADLLKEITSIVLPNLEHVPFALSVVCTDGQCLAYGPELFPARGSTIILHAPGEIQLDVERGELRKGDSRMLRSRSRPQSGESSPLRKARKTSSRGSPTNSPTAAAANPPTAEEVNRVVNTVTSAQLRQGLQGAMRSWCHRRDQVCVVSGETTDDSLKCAHILTPEYGEEWFAERSDWSLQAGVPVVASRYSPSMDVRNGIMLRADLHENFDAFRFSIYAKGEKFFVHAFRPMADLVHGSEIIVPMLNDRHKPPSFYRDLFPHRDVVMEQFKQAVLHNVRAAGESKDLFEDTDEDGVGYETFGESLELEGWEDEREIERKLELSRVRRTSSSTIYDSPALA
ncbi:uncharacterized protein EV422DRAFT_570039 [Fimicolochytrium jonesii]|uniref:uncharacterized protein n=1 Tax=Fimicolochytrium jonesii TaxID=1396493 RepID=UPI0022FF13AB|nr:uncharacterized protein EV422DRAFT_570039 [Fimicolochytrium jonesii]KAI8818265.1 hypothetical protein EV422DRAFT_570039 [Fimicolochytrium jonesii]